MKKDILYLLNLYASEDSQLEFCRECAEIIGLIEYHPRLLEFIEIRRIQPQRPRKELIELLGSDHQHCPVLIIQNYPENLPTHMGISQSNETLHVVGSVNISRYLSSVYGTAKARRATEVIPHTFRMYS